MYTPGHINHTDGSLVTSFRVKLRNDETRTWSVFYFCQSCNHIEPAATTDNASKLAAFQKLHFHEKGEN
jgi:5-methylcytosine-specific restriction endonuclease McrA